MEANLNLNKPQSATGSQVTSNTYSMNVIVIVEPIYTVWTSTENDKINFGK